MAKILILLFFACTIFKSNVVFAQFGLMAGTNYSNIRQQIPRIDTGHQLDFHLGLNYSWNPIESLPDFSIRTDLLLNNKGYRQILDDGHRQVRFKAIGLAPMLRYQIARTTGLHSGLEFNYFFDGNTVGSSEVFRQSERAVFLGIDLFNHRSVSFYIRGIFGVSPLLDYVDFDPFDASIKGEFSDFFSTTVLFGIQFFIRDEKKRN